MMMMMMTDCCWGNFAEQSLSLIRLRRRRIRRRMNMAKMVLETIFAGECTIADRTSKWPLVGVSFNMNFKVTLGAEC